MSDEITDSPSTEGKAPAFLNDAAFIELNGKRPVARKWNTDPDARFDATTAYERVAAGGNVGVVLGANDLVLDVDPRNFDGVDRFAQLKKELGLDLSEYPTVKTGSGGLHVYMRLPEGAGRFKNDLGDDGYPGVELKCIGRQVVAPGSIHPETGEPYVVEIDLDPLDEGLGLPLAPKALLEIGSKPARSRDEVTPGAKSPAWLEGTLEHLDPTLYRGEHDRWVELMMACHHATDGAGGHEFVAWSASDPMYDDRAEENIRRWDSLDAGIKGGVTERTLFKHLDDAGVLHLVQPDLDEATDDFDEIDPLDEPNLPHAINATKAKRQANAKKARAAKAEKAAIRKLKRAESMEAYADWINRTFVYDRSTGKRVNVDTGEAYDDQVFENEFGPGWARDRKSVV